MNWQSKANETSKALMEEPHRLRLAFHRPSSIPIWILDFGLGNRCNRWFRKLTCHMRNLGWYIFYPEPLLESFWIDI